jgi:hypothetical protein
MPIPPLNKHGVLPPGIHHCAITEIGERFGKRDFSPKRHSIWSGFTAFIEWIRPWGVFRTGYVDGSFVTDKPEPNDVDVLLELPAPKPGVLHAFEPKLFHQDYVHRKYKVHLWFHFPGTLPGQNDFRLFFQYIRPREAAMRKLKSVDRKGILRIEI